MKVIQKCITAFLAVILLSSCNFDETDCEYRGILKANNEWSHLLQEQVIPPVSAMSLVYYPTAGDALKMEIGSSEQFRDSYLIRALNIGKYDLLFFNKGTDNKVKGLDNSTYGEIYSETEIRKGRRFIVGNQEYVYSSFRQGVQIHTDDTTYCTFKPTILVQKISFNLLIKNADNQPEIKRLRCELDGVITSRWLATAERGLEYATRAFECEQKEKDHYTSSILVFGINKTANNNLRIEAEFDEGTFGDTDIDLDDMLDGFDGDEIEITIEIDVSPNLRLSAKIIDWKEKDYGTIVIQ